MKILIITWLNTWYQMSMSCIMGINPNWTFTPFSGAYMDASGRYLGQHLSIFMGICVCCWTLLKRKKAWEELEVYISNYCSLDLFRIILVYNYLFPKKDVRNFVTLCSLNRYVNLMCVCFFFAQHVLKDQNVIVSDW